MSPLKLRSPPFSKVISAPPDNRVVKFSVFKEPTAWSPVIVKSAVPVTVPALKSPVPPLTVKRSLLRAKVEPEPKVTFSKVTLPLSPLTVRAPLSPTLKSLPVKLATTATWAAPSRSRVFCVPLTVMFWALKLPLSKLTVTLLSPLPFKPKSAAKLKSWAASVPWKLITASPLVVPSPILRLWPELPCSRV